MSTIATDSTPRGPFALSRAILDAVRPEIERHGVAAVARSHPRAAELYAAAFRALVPIVGRYTVADAVLLALALEAVAEMEPSSIRQDADCPVLTALREAINIFGDFIASAAPSSPACVSARAYWIRVHPVDDMLSDANVRDLRLGALHDVTLLRSGDFSDGERFGDSVRERLAPANWYRRAIDLRTPETLAA